MLVTRERQVRCDGEGGARHAVARSRRVDGGKRICRLAARVLFAASIVLSLAAEAHAQAAPNTENPPVDRRAAEAEYNRVFQQLLKDPSDLDVLFRFVELASTLDYYEPAITALEGMLLVSPDLPQIKFELGVLYYLIASYDMARSYLTEARDTPNVPKEIHDRATAFLAEIDKRAPAQ